MNDAERHWTFHDDSSGVFTLHGPEGKQMFALKPDGTFEWGEGVTPDEAAVAFAEVVSSMLGRAWRPPITTTEEREQNTRAALVGTREERLAQIRRRAEHFVDVPYHIHSGESADALFLLDALEQAERDRDEWNERAVVAIHRRNGAERSLENAEARLAAEPALVEALEQVQLDLDVEHSEWQLSVQTERDVAAALAAYQQAQEPAK